LHCSCIAHVPFCDIQISVSLQRRIYLVSWRPSNNDHRLDLFLRQEVVWRKIQKRKRRLDELEEEERMRERQSYHDCSCPLSVSLTPPPSRTLFNISFLRIEGKNDSGIKSYSTRSALSEARKI
jgi:hypothetical protein